MLTAHLLRILTFEERRNDSSHHHCGISMLAISYTSEPRNTPLIGSTTSSATFNPSALRINLPRRGAPAAGAP